MLEKLVYAWFDHRPRSLDDQADGASELLRTIPSSSPAARLEIVVDDAVVEVALRGELLLGDLEPRVDRLGASRCPAPAAARAGPPGRAGR